MYEVRKDIYIMKKLCAFIICAIISVCIGAHMVNTKNEAEIELMQIKETKKEIENLPTILEQATNKEYEQEKESTTEITENKNTDIVAQNTTQKTSVPSTTTQTQEIAQPSVVQKPTTTAKPSVESQSEFYLSDYERWVVECIVMGEAGGETYEGQVLLAQCILNGVVKEGVQPSELRRKYEYAGWNENPSSSVKKAVSDVFDKGYKITDEYILYFYAPKYTTSSWHESQRFVCEVGNHRFFAEW